MTVTTAFNITNSAGNVIGTVDVTYSGPNINGASITAVSGTINGQPITGLSNFNGADNLVYWQGQISIRNALLLGFDAKGLSFTAGGVNYNLTNTSLLASNNPTPQTITTIGVYQTGPLCFVSGTRIATLESDVVVENLCVGDQVVTALGETRTVVWIGHNALDCKFKENLSPVRVL